MKKCPYCAEEIQNDAIKCRFGNEFLDKIPSQRVEIEPTLEEQRKWAEIRRLQQIVNRQPTHAATLRKTKGLISIVVIIAIMLYVYVWNQKYSQTRSESTSFIQANFSFEEINALFGPVSPLPPDLKKQLFAKHLGKRLIWTGTLTYINLGQGDNLFMTAQTPMPIPSAGVQVRFRAVNRKQLESLQIGQFITFSGLLMGYDETAQFFSFRDGSIVANDEGQ